MSRSISPSRDRLRPAAGQIFPFGGVALAAATLAVTLAACQGDIVDRGPAAPPGGEASGAAVAGAAASEGAPAALAAGDVIGLPVEFTRKEPALIPVGETGSIEVRFEVRHAIEGLRLEVTGDDGLEVLTPRRTLELGDLGAGDVVTERFEVRPSRKGLHYLKVHVQGRRDGRTLGHSGAVPVLTSEDARRAALETPGRLIVDPTGRKIIEMSAQGPAIGAVSAGDAPDRR